MKRQEGFFCLFYAQARTQGAIPDTWNYAAKAAYGPRGEQGRRAFPYSMVQGRIREIVADATCAPRGEQCRWECPCLIVQGSHGG